jgi:hypothetical protein
MRLFGKMVNRLKTLRTLRKSLRSLRLESKIVILNYGFARGIVAEILCGTKWNKDCSG